MPYKIVKQGNKYLTVNKDTGKIKGTHDSKAKAIAQMRLLYGIDAGRTPKKRFSRRTVEKAYKKLTHPGYQS
jgi:hypothetical protein